jgi:hypothetical protein
VSELTPTERTLRARAAAHTLHSQVDSTEHMKPAQAASPGQRHYWEQQVDPDHKLDEVERRRRADQAHKAHMTKLALASARARRQRKNAVA